MRLFARRLAPEKSEIYSRRRPGAVFAIKHPESACEDLAGLGISVLILRSFWYAEDAIGPKVPAMARWEMRAIVLAFGLAWNDTVI